MGQGLHLRLDRRSVMAGNLAGVLTSALGWTRAASAEPSAAGGVTALQAAQAAANSRPGARTTPARVLPVPDDVDPATCRLVEGPYSSFWNIDPPSEAAWREVLSKAARAAQPREAELRRRLGVSIAPTTLGGVNAFVLTPAHIPPAHLGQVVFHIHGGGYVFGGGESGTGEAAIMAAHGGYKVIAIDYRMPPDHPYPAALDDLVAAWRALTAMTDPHRVAVEGTSTGGGLALALMLRLKAGRLPMPAAIAPGSPWSDLTKTGDSYWTNEWVDNVVVSYDRYLARAARLYANGHDLRDPELSPVYGDLGGFPPAILTAGTRDLFLSNTVRVHRKLREAGVAADLQVFEGLSHAQCNADPFAPRDPRGLHGGSSLLRCAPAALAALGPPSPVDQSLGRKSPPIEEGPREGARLTSRRLRSVCGQIERCSRAAGGRTPTAIWDDSLGARRLLEA